MSLSKFKIQSAQPREKDYKLFDGHGLYLLIKKNGAKYWRLKYRYGGKEKTLALGVYGAGAADVSLAMARSKTDIARIQLSKDVDPGLDRKKKKLATKIRVQNTFQSVAQDWIESRTQLGVKGKWSPRHESDVKHTLSRDIYPDIGNMPITEVDVQTLRTVLEKTINRGALETASRLRQRCSAVFRHGITLALCEKDPADSLKEIIRRPESKSMPSLTPGEFPSFYRAMLNYQGERITCLATQLLSLTFVRTGELIGAEWGEINLDEGIWNIPPARMKRARAHFVPLATQTVAILDELHEITGDGKLLFPKQGNPKSKVSMSNGTILRVIDRLGYRNRMSGHGFRSVASTALNESQLFSLDAIEKQLSHDDDDKVRAAYNNAKYMRERKKMMQWWAEKLDAWASPSQVAAPRLNTNRQVT